MTTQVPLFAAAPADFPTAGYSPSFEPQTPAAAAPPADWEEQTLIVSLTLRAPGQTKQVKGVDVTKRQKTIAPDGTQAPAADPEELKVDKYLYESEAFDAVVSHQNKTRDWVKARCVPSKLLKSGLYRVAVGLVNDIEEYLTTARTALGYHVDLIQARNVTGDSALTAAAARARQAMTGVDPQDLRDSSRLRSRVAEQFQAIERDLQATPKAARSISFQEV